MVFIRKVKWVYVPRRVTGPCSPRGRKIRHGMLYVFSDTNISDSCVDTPVRLRV